MWPQNQAWEALSGRQRPLRASLTAPVGLLVRVGTGAGKLSPSWRPCILGRDSGKFWGCRQVTEMLPLARTQGKSSYVPLLAPETGKFEFSVLSQRGPLGLCAFSELGAEMDTEPWGWGDGHTAPGLGGRSLVLVALPQVRGWHRTEPKSGWSHFSLSADGMGCLSIGQQDFIGGVRGPDTVAIILNLAG